MKPIRAAFFDVDGVLLDSLTSHLRICEDKSREYGLGLQIPGPLEFKNLVRRGMRISPMKFFFLAVGFPEDAAEKADLQYQNIFMEQYAPAPFPGVHEMLAALSNAGLPLGVVTANVIGNVETALGHDMKYFHPRALMTKDHPPGLTKASGLLAGAAELGLAPQELIYVGDQPADYSAAEEAGVRFLGVTYGWGISSEDRAFPTVGSPAHIADYILAAAQ